MTIGIDIDDTLVQTNVMALEFIRKEDPNSKIDYYEQLNNLSDFISKYFKLLVKTATLFENAAEVVNYFHDKGYRIIFVTSRATQSGADTEEDTINYLNKNNIKYDAIYLKKHDKVDVCLKEKIDVFIDDKEKVLVPLNDIGIKCIKFDSIDKGPSAFEKASTWKEIKEIIDNL